MSQLPFGEIFGRAVDDNSAQAGADRRERRCPFRGSPCTKVNEKDPLGICSLSSGNSLITLCPSRFLQSQRIITDVGRLAFGKGAKVIAAPEVHILRVPNSSGTGTKRVGKVDFLVAKLDENDRPVDFAALEVQAVYVSGEGMRTVFRKFLETGMLEPGSKRRPDWRSSIQKRLMPQLLLKVPVFRRWGKKFFVAVDSHFFKNIPAFRRTNSIENSEITWLIYPFAQKGTGYSIQEPTIVWSVWDDVMSALREGTSPQPDEILADIDSKKRRFGLTAMLT